MTFGGQGLGLPGFGFPWRERRFEAPDLRVVLMPAQVAAEVQARLSVNDPPPQASTEQTVADGPTLKPSLALSKIPALEPAQTVEAVTPKIARTETAVPAARNEPADATDAVAAIAPPPITAPTVIAVERSEAATFVVPPPPPVPTPVVAVAPSMPSPESVLPTPPVEAAKLEAARQEAQRQEDARLAATKLEAQRQADKLEAARVEAAKLDTAQQEAARVQSERQEAARLETQRQEAARSTAAKLEAQGQEVARQDAARVEAARLETLRQEAARLATAQLDAQRQEVARREAARADATRLEAARATARLETERQTAVRQAAAQQEAARIQEEKEEDARREARRQAMGRTLNEEAAKREAAVTAARSPSTLPYSLSTARRARLWGRTDPNVELVQYAEAWARKIQFNTSVDAVREVAARPHTNPMVTVAIRSDGSVESVTFVLSSGVAEVDEAIRRIVQSGVPYPAFPPGLAREVDVLEVRRTWHFDTAVRLY